MFAWSSTNSSLHRVSCTPVHEGAEPAQEQSTSPNPLRLALHCIGRHLALGHLQSAARQPPWLGIFIQERAFCLPPNLSSRDSSSKDPTVTALILDPEVPALLQHAHRAPADGISHSRWRSWFPVTQLRCLQIPELALYQFTVASVLSRWSTYVSPSRVSASNVTTACSEEMT